MLKLLSTFSLMFISLAFPLNAQVDINPADLDLSMEVKDVKNRPKLKINISKTGIYTIDKIAFTIEQLAVVFKNIRMTNAKIMLHLTIQKDVDQKHIINLLNTSTKAGISEISIAKPTK